MGDCSPFRSGRFVGALLPDPIERRQGGGLISTADLLSLPQIFEHTLADRRQGCGIQPDGLGRVVPQLDARNPRQHKPIGGDGHQVIGQQPPAPLQQGIGKGGFAIAGVAQAHDGPPVLLQRIAMEHQHAPLDQQSPHRRTKQEGAQVLVAHLPVLPLPADVPAAADAKPADAFHREPQVGAGHLHEGGVVLTCRQHRPGGGLFRLDRHGGNGIAR